VQRARPVWSEPGLVEPGEAWFDDESVAEHLAEITSERVAVAADEIEAVGVRAVGGDERVLEQQASWRSWTSRSVTAVVIAIPPQARPRRASLARLRRR
jgi:hypothetical protein